MPPPFSKFQRLTGRYVELAKRNKARYAIIGKSMVPPQYLAYLVFFGGRFTTCPWKKQNTSLSSPSLSSATLKASVDEGISLPTKDWLSAVDLTPESTRDWITFPFHQGQFKIQWAPGIDNSISQCAIPATSTTFMVRSFTLHTSYAGSNALHSA